MAIFGYNPYERLLGQRLQDRLPRTREQLLPATTLPRTMDVVNPVVSSTDQTMYNNPQTMGMDKMGHSSNIDSKAPTAPETTSMVQEQGNNQETVPVAPKGWFEQARDDLRTITDNPSFGRALAGFGEGVYQSGLPTDTPQSGLSTLAQGIRGFSEEFSGGNYLTPEEMQSLTPEEQTRINNALNNAKKNDPKADLNKIKAELISGTRSDKLIGGRLASIGLTTDDVEKVRYDGKGQLGRANTKLLEKINKVRSAAKLVSDRLQAAISSPDKAFGFSGKIRDGLEFIGAGSSENAFNTSLQVLNQLDYTSGTKGAISDAEMKLFGRASIIPTNFSKEEFIKAMKLLKRKADIAEIVTDEAASIELEGYRTKLSGHRKLVDRAEKAVGNVDDISYSSPAGTTTTPSSNDGVDVDYVNSIGDR